MASIPLDEKAIFNVARKIDSPDAREDYLEQVCGANRSLFDRVSALLDAYEKEQSFLESPPAGAAPTIEQPIAERPGTMIGRYKLLEQIGEGGMGVVYMAEQREPVRRKVALKIIKPGMDTKEVVVRFEAERQALALMDHPNIAKVHDGGATESGRPYFVMELVHGIPLTDYCDENQLTTRERLELFVQVCSAVQHAHQKGIIHRDIKPSNVMVTLHDHLAVPKIIDFGIAKATNRQLTEKTIFTGYGQMVGTPLYMSPEQAGLSGLDVDTRTDIYSLGVLLYELLTGSTPFDRERLREADFDEVRRMIREEEPPAPSARFSTLAAEAATTISARRKTDPAKLSNSLRGELDWIVMKALEKDRTRRYETAVGLAQDVQRYLDDEPVEACPPSTWYRLGKFYRRNKVALVTVAAVALSLVLGLVGTGWEAVRATNAEGEAKEQQGIAEQRLTDTEEQRRRAEVNFTLAREAVHQMVTRVADEHLSYIPAMKEVRRQLLEDAAAFYGELLKLNPDDPVAYYNRARVYRLLAEFAKARADYEKSLELQPDNAEVHCALAGLLGSGLDPTTQDMTRSLVHAKRAIELSPETSRYHQLLGAIHYVMGNYDQALRPNEEAVELDPKRASARAGLSYRYGILGKHDRALAEAKKAVELEPHSPESHLALGCAYETLEKHEEALAAFDRAVDIAPPNGLETYRVYWFRGDFLARRQRYDEALADYNKAIELAPLFRLLYKQRASAYVHLKDYTKALADYQKAIDIDPEKDGSGVKRAAAFARRGNILLNDLQQPDKAAAEYSKAIALDPENPDLYQKRGDAHKALGDSDKAEADYQKTEQFKRQ